MTLEEKELWKKYIENINLLESFINKSKEFQNKLRKLKSEIFKNIDNDFFEDKTEEINIIEKNFYGLELKKKNIEKKSSELEKQIGFKNNTRT